MDVVTTARTGIGPYQWFNRWTKKRGADRNALVREGSEIVTLVIDFAKRVGPAGIMPGSHEEIYARLRGWDEEWVDLRARLLTYTNGHPGELRKAASTIVEAMGTSLSATWYLFLSLNTAPQEDGMQNFRNAERRQNEAIALAEKLLQEIRDY